MKYKYRKILFFLQITLLILFMIVLLLYLQIRGSETRTISRTAASFAGLMAVFGSLMTKEYLSRYVEFHNNYVTFYSYRVKKKVYNFDVKYENILNLNATMIPILGIYKVKVKAKNLPADIPVTWCISKHNEMFSTLCEKAEKSNPNVYIDSRIIKHLEKKGYRETN